MGRAVRVLWLSSRGMVEDYQSVAALAMPHGRQQCGHIWQWRPSRVVFLQPGGVLSVGVTHRGQQQERQGLQCRQLWQVETVCCWHWAAYTMQAAALMAGQAAMLASSAALVCCTSAGWAVASARRLSGFDGCRRRRRRSRPLFIELQGYESFSLRHQVQGYSRGAQGADRAAGQLDLACSGFQWRQQLGAGGTCMRNRGWWLPLDVSSEVENLSK